MRITQQNESGSIECTYDSNYDKENFRFTVPTGRYGAIVMRVNLYVLDELIDTLQRFREVIKVVTRR